MSKIYGVISIFVCAFICVVTYYLCLPATTFHSGGFWLYIMLCIACVGITVSVFLSEDEDNLWLALKITGIVIGSVFVLFLVLAFFSGNMIHAERARSVAKVTVSEATIEEAFPDLTIEENLEKFPLVDMDTAILLGDKKIAGISHASWYDVDNEYNLITYQGKNYRLSVIDYGDFFKFNKARHDGLPGYVLVEVTPENGKVVQDATVVVLDQPIMYSPGAFWAKDLRRHLRSQFNSYMFDKSYLEIDESGTPYWVTGVLRPTAGLFGVKTVTSFILTNAQTGESKEVYVSDAPEWIDHVFSLNYLMSIAEWHYSYIDGFLNSIFSKTNVWRTSYYFRSSHKTENDNFTKFFGYNSTLDPSGQVMFYTGLTAANNAESNLAWLEIDTSTGEMVQYNIVGAEESSAQAAVETLVQEKGYEATFPLPANIGGYPSYIMALKGKAGLVQCYGICNIENYSKAVVADTLDEAINDYLMLLDPEKYIVEEPEPEVPEPEEPKDPTETPVVVITTESLLGTIEEIYTAEIDGTTQFYYQIEGNLYRSPITINEQQITLGVGDMIAFNYYEANNIYVVTALDIVPPSEETTTE